MATFNSIISGMPGAYHISDSDFLFAITFDDFDPHSVNEGQDSEYYRCQITIGARLIPTSDLTKFMASTLYFYNRTFFET